MEFLEAIGAYQDHLLNHFTTIYPDCVEQEPLPKSRERDATWSLIARLTPRHISPDSACRNR